MHLLIFLLSCMIIACLYCSAEADLPPFSSTDRLGNLPFQDKTTVSPCSACSNLAKSFLKALAETTRQSFAGGDTAWEEEKLGSYENSELRFIEIQEKLCSDIGSGKDQCFNLAEQHEDDLENWFFKKRMKKVELFPFLCIEKLKLCCPDNTYGPKCVPCPGGIEKPCGGHGKCVNGGTREAPAYCTCDAGYTGKLCDKCDQGYYQDADSSPLSCKSCDESCKRHCRGPGPKNCEVCSTGYYFIQNEGCIKNDSLDDANSEFEPNETVDSELNLNPELETTATAQSEHLEL